MRVIHVVARGRWTHPEYSEVISRSVVDTINTYTTPNLLCKDRGKVIQNNILPFRAEVIHLQHTGLQTRSSALDRGQCSASYSHQRYLRQAFLNRYQKVLKFSTGNRQQVLELCILDGVGHSALSASLASSLLHYHNHHYA